MFEKCSTSCSGGNKNAVVDDSPYYPTSLAKTPLVKGCRVSWRNPQSLVKSHQRVRNSSIAAPQLSAVAYGVQRRYRGGVCPLTLCMSSPSVPLRAQADRDGGFAVWFSSRGSIDSFKVESTCHCFNHPWPHLHVGRPQRGTGSAACMCVCVCVRAVKRKRKRRRRDSYRERIKKHSDLQR